MSDRLNHLVTDYLRDVAVAASLLENAGRIRRLPGGAFVVVRDRKCWGELADGTRYFQHGAGYEVFLEAGPVDFDYGLSDSLIEWDPWFLRAYAKTRLKRYGYADLSAVEIDIRRSQESLK